MLVRLSAGYEALEGFMELGRREVWALAKEVGWHGKGISINFVSRGVVVIFLGCCPETEHDPGELLFPVVRNASCHEGCFQTAMKALDHSVRFRVVGSCCCSGNAESLSELRPEARGEH